MSLGSGQNLVLLTGAAVMHSLRSLTDIVVLKADTSADTYFLVNKVFVQMFKYILFSFHISLQKSHF